jgi:hypothetical protein
MSKIGDKIYVGNDVYIACEDANWNCRGCSAIGDDLLCTEITNVSSCRDVIWIKQPPVETQATTCNQTKGEPEMNTDKSAKNTVEEPKYTLAEFLEACNDWYGTVYCDSENRYNHFKQFLERKNNPEYQEYLRLKAIYG